MGQCRKMLFLKGDIMFSRLKNRLFGRELEEKDPIEYEIGSRVIGARSPIAYVGVLVRKYRTKQKAYVIKCDIDGKERSFQCIKSIELCNKLRSPYIKVYR